MQQAKAIKNELLGYANEKKAGFLPQFFKAFKGGYGEGDVFIGVTVPHMRAVAKQYYKTISLAGTEALLNFPEHECRLVALYILILKYEKTKKPGEKSAIVTCYLNNIGQVNNWDLVDSSAYKILGPYLENKDKKLLYDFANSGDLWKQRIAIITTLHFIKKHQFTDTLEITKILLHHQHDLIHKAVGWMLREIGKKNYATEYNFLKTCYKQMPRTMLRYAVERFDEDVRQKFLKGKI